MSTGGTLGVRLAALRATVSLVSSLEAPEQRKGFQDLVSEMLQALGAALVSDEDKAQEALALLVSLAEEDARFVRKYINELALAMLQIAEAGTLEAGTRSLAIELLLTLSEARDSAPGMIRKLDALVGRLVACVVGFLLDIEEDAAWATATEEEHLDAGQGELFEVGMEALDRLACSLGGKAVLPVLSAVLAPMLGAPDWKQRHAALCTLAQVAEGCSKQMRRDPAGAAAAPVRMLADDHPRVRWAAINAIGQMCTDLGPELQHRAHAAVMPGLIRVMDDAGNPRVQAHAAAAVVNFAEECDPEVLAPYMDALLQKLLTMLQQSTRPVQEAALTAMASVADTAQAQFERYYDTVMPFLLHVVGTANDPSYRMLRARAIECATLVGMAVGKERFRAHARAVIDIMVGLQRAGPAADEPDDPTPSYLLQGFARLCTVMGNEFVPYLEVVMPPLLAAAEVKPDVRVRDAEDAASPEEEDEDCQLIAVGDQVLAIRTSVLEEKATACDMLCCYAEQLQEGFLPYLERTAGIMIPLLKFYLSEEVRSAAVAIMPSLVKAGRAAVDKQLRDGAWLASLVTAVWTPLLAALNKEPDSDVAAAMLVAVAATAEGAGTLLTPEQMGALTDELLAQLGKSAQRTTEFVERTRGEEYDEEERELLAEEAAAEDELVDQVQECVASLLRAFGAAYLPYLQRLAPAILPMLGAPSATQRRIAVCIFDDVMEFASDASGASGPYFDAFYPAVLAGAGDGVHHDLRQACAYGLGVCAQHCPDRFRPKAPEAVAALVASVRAPGSRTEDAADATDNAVSALGKAVEFCGDAFDSAPVLQLWLDYLPVRADTAEAQAVHAQLCRFMQAGDARLLGAANERLPRVIAVFADCLAAGDPLITAATAENMRSLLRRMQAAMPAEQLGAAWAQLSAEQQAALSAALATTGAPA